jgi:hypothetical protein
VSSSITFAQVCNYIFSRLAQTQQYDQDGIIEIFRQYGDHLYSKGDHDRAIEQYIKTIGKLEASYVIRKVSFVFCLFLLGLTHTFSFSMPNGFTI